MYLDGEVENQAALEHQDDSKKKQGLQSGTFNEGCMRKLLISPWSNKYGGAAVVTNQVRFFFNATIS